MGIDYSKKGEPFMNRFFGKSENISDDTIIIDGSDVNHIKNVLRMRQGDKLIVTGGNNRDYVCSVREYAQDKVFLDIVNDIETDRELPADIYLFQGLPKGDKMELIIQKCVELGVHAVIPVAMKRCVVKLDDKKSAAKIKRWQAISESAAKQSGRGVIPEVMDVMSFDDAIEYVKSNGMNGIIPYELAEGMEASRRAVESVKPGMKVAVFIGPEGGFDLTEVKKAVDAGMQEISLGRRILRTETAGLAIMSILMYHLEEV